MADNTNNKRVVTYYSDKGVSLTDEEIDNNFHAVEDNKISSVSTDNGQLNIGLVNGENFTADLNGNTMGNLQSESIDIQSVGDTTTLETYGNLIPFSNVEDEVKVEVEMGGWKVGDVIPKDMKLSDIVAKIFKKVEDVEVENLIDFGLKVNEKDQNCEDRECLYTDNDLIRFDIEQEKRSKIEPYTFSDKIVYLCNWLDSDLGLKYDLKYNFFKVEGQNYEILKESESTEGINNYFKLINNAETNSVMLYPNLTEEGVYQLGLELDYSAKHKPIEPTPEPEPKPEVPDVKPIEPTDPEQPQDGSVQNSGEIVRPEDTNANYPISLMSLDARPIVDKEFIEDIVKSDGSPSLKVIEKGSIKKVFEIMIGYRFYYKSYNETILDAKLEDLVEDCKLNGLGGLCEQGVTSFDVMKEEGNNYLMLYVPKKYSKLTLNDNKCVPVYTFKNNRCVAVNTYSQPSVEEYKVFILDIEDFENINIKLNPIEKKEEPIIPPTEGEEVPNETK